MSVAKPSFEQVDPPRSPKETLPTMYDLPSEDPEEPGLPDEFHIWQAQLCSSTFRPPHYEDDQIFVASDLNLYYDPRHPGWYKRPDWFGVVGVSRLYQGRDLRMSYVIWQEGVRPVVAMEFLSASTRDQDLGEDKRSGQQPTKWEVYEQILGIPYYVTFDRITNELQIFKLNGAGYQPQTLNHSKLWIPHIQLGLGLWQGEYRGLERLWLRWYDQEGNWVPTEVEREQQQREQAEFQRLRAEEERLRAEAERLRAEQERIRAEEERQQKERAQQQAEAERMRAERLAERLRQMGINPDDLE